METPEFRWMAPFLVALADVPNVSAACRTAGISRVQAYARKNADPEFAAAWEDALDQSVDDLVGAMYRRAKNGVREPVYHNGVRCGSKLRYSDTLAIFLAKCHRPGVYGDRVAQEHSGELTVKVEYEDVDPPFAPPPPGPAPRDGGSEPV